MRSGYSLRRDSCFSRRGRIHVRSFRGIRSSRLLNLFPAPSAHSYLGHTADDYIPRPNDCDYLFEVGRFRLHLVTSLLGSRPPSHVESLYISPGRKGVAPGSFTSHPPCFVHYGTGERCQAEGERLVKNLRRDAVRVEQVVTEDTPHDPLLLEMLWNRQQIQQIWDGALQFLGTL